MGAKLPSPFSINGAEQVNTRHAAERGAGREGRGLCVGSVLVLEACLDASHHYTANNGYGLLWEQTRLVTEQRANVVTMYQQNYRRGRAWMNYLR